MLDHRHLVLLLGFVPLACPWGSAPKTDNVLIDEVVSREAANSPCVAYSNRTQVSDDDPNGPPAMLTPEVFSEPEIRRAAARIATDWQDAPKPTRQVVGKVEYDRCLMQVAGPSFSGDYAFLAFSDPVGEIGAYAFRKSGIGWRVDEKVSLGFW